MCCFYWKDFYLITSRVCSVSTKTQVTLSVSKCFSVLRLTHLEKDSGNKGVKSSLLLGKGSSPGFKARLEPRDLDTKTLSFRAKHKLAMF